jgi:hypothetical protein
MAITGGVKFFGDNVALYEAGGYVIASTGQVVALNIIDKLSYTSWRSVGSNDSTVETLVVTFGSSTITRLLLLNHNWKNFTVQYWNGSTWVNFTSVVGLDGSKSAISETAFADNSAYYEFASVTTTQIKNHDQHHSDGERREVPGDADGHDRARHLRRLPKDRSTDVQPQSQDQSDAVGSKEDREAAAGLCLHRDVRELPGARLRRRFRSRFLALRSRGTVLRLALRRQARANYFSYDVPGWRLKDVFRVQTDTDITSEWSDNMYKRGQNLGSILFSEHV